MTVILVYCQTGYPKKQVIESDTVVLLNQNQIRTINDIFDQRDFYKFALDSINVKLNTQILLLENQSYINELLVSKNNELFIELDSWRNKDKINKQLQEYYKKEIKQQKDRGFKLAVGGVIIGVASTSLLFLILNK